MREGVSLLYGNVELAAGSLEVDWDRNLLSSVDVAGVIFDGLLGRAEVDHFYGEVSEDCGLGLEASGGGESHVKGSVGGSADFFSDVEVVFVG